MISAGRSHLSQVYRKNPADAAVFFALCCCALPVFGWLMLLWKSHGVFTQYDIVFDADPSARLEQFAHGWNGAIVHPILDYIVSLPLRAITVVTGRLHLTGPPIPFRESVAVWVTPAVSALKTGVGYLFGRLVGGTRTGSVGLSLLVGFSLSPAVFGALPEHLPLTAFMFTAAFAWAAAVQFQVVPDREDVWMLLTFLVTGFTVTNIVPVSFLFFACRLSRGESWRRGLAATALLALISGGAAIATSLIYARIMPRPDRVTTFTKKYLRRPDRPRALRFLPSLATSVIGTYPGTIPNDAARAANVKGLHQMDLQFSYDILPLTAWRWSVTLVILAIVAAGAWSGWRADPRFGGLAIGALGILLFNFALHWIWGAEWLLYSLHWHAALMTLLSGWLVGGARRTGIFMVLFGVGAATSSALVIARMLIVLEHTPR
jgi:hypothetical protein